MSATYWIIALSCLTFIILIHESGHFFIARLFKVKVLRFCIGFGPILYSRTSKASGTEFALAAIPLGGYISMLDKDRVENEQDKLQCLDYKPLWQRCLIVAAGPAANLLSAMVFFAMAFMLGTNDIAAVIGEVSPISSAYTAGVSANHEIVAVNREATTSWSAVHSQLVADLPGSQAVSLTLKDINSGALSQHKLWLTATDIAQQPLAVLGITPYLPPIPAKIGRLISATAIDSGLEIGDLVTKFNQQPINDWQELVQALQNNPGQTANWSLVRNNKVVTLAVSIGEKVDNLGKKTGYLGIAPPAIDWPEWMLRKHSLSIGNALATAWTKTGTTIVMIGESFKLLFSGNISRQQLMGPIGIVKITGESSQAGLAALLIMLAFLSINIGLLNLLPIPVLDGGHLVYLFIEFIAGVKAANLCKRLTMPIGLALILCLTVFAVFNDINNLG